MQHRDGCQSTLITVINTIDWLKSERSQRSKKVSAEVLMFKIVRREEMAGGTVILDGLNSGDDRIYFPEHQSYFTDTNVKKCPQAT